MRRKNFMSLIYGNYFFFRPLKFLGTHKLGFGSPALVLRQSGKKTPLRTNAGLGDTPDPTGSPANRAGEVPWALLHGTAAGFVLENTALTNEPNTSTIPWNGVLRWNFQPHLLRVEISYPTKLPLFNELFLHTHLEIENPQNVNDTHTETTGFRLQISPRTKK